MNGCDNPKISSTTNLGEHIPRGLSMSVILLFKEIKNKHDVWRGEDCIKSFCECLKKYTRRINNFKKKKMKLLRKERGNHVKNQKSAIFVEKHLKINVLIKTIKTIVELLNIEVLHKAYII